MRSRDYLIEVAKGFIGATKGDAKHKLIIDTYNSYVSANKGGKHKGSAYKVKYTDAWCATFVSAIAVMCNYTDIIPTECSCTRMIRLLKELGCYEGNDNYVPKKGDIIFYKWNLDNGAPIPNENYDVDGLAHHVGIVEDCDGKTITVIEGNYGDKHTCGRRTVKVGWKYIHGFGLPRYDKEEEKGTPASYTVKRGDSLYKIAKTYNTTVAELLRLNPFITNKNLIRVGWEIKLK